MTDAERQGWGRILAYYTAEWPDHPCCVVVARDDMLRRREATVREVLRTHCQAVAWAQDHPAETAQIIVDTLGAFDPDVVEASLDPSKMRLDCQVDPDEIARMAQLMAAQGLIDRVPATRDLVDLGPLHSAGGEP
jgi:NitT/TauT family transport system substrate-binding protein